MYAYKFAIYIKLTIYADVRTLVNKKKFIKQVL
jgi:hypothetical protein